jgi:mannosyltransferase OCH1-like enzyme
MNKFALKKFKKKSPFSILRKKKNLLRFKLNRYLQKNHDHKNIHSHLQDIQRRIKENSIEPLINHIFTKEEEYINIQQSKKPIKSIIPLHIFQTWWTKDLPKHMLETVLSVKNQNPEFEYHLYDDHDCLDFIKNNFPQSVSDAYKSLIPGAYKADLWRYCVLYIYGGIYIDIKFKCAPGFKFIELTDKEHFCNDFKKKKRSIYNGIIIAKPKNPLLLKAIQNVVKNVKRQYYGKGSLFPTGPILLGKIFKNKNMKDVDMRLAAYNKNGLSIKYQGRRILTFYNSYRNEQRKFSNKPHYHILWKRKAIYHS